MEIEFEDYTYELSEEITGKDYLDLQQTLAKANKDIGPEVTEVLRLFALEVEKAKQEGIDEESEDFPDIKDVDMPTPNMAQYGLENIVARLKSWSRDGAITRESILALPSAHYQVLHWEGLRLDGQEQSRATNFLVKHLPTFKQEELASALENFSDSPQDGLEQPTT